jgi:glycosyltransferase involved in cell wall biosynthesis
LFKDNKLRQQMALNGRRLVEQRFTWARVADMYETLYRQIIHEHDERSQAGLT